MTLTLVLHQNAGGLRTLGRFRLGGLVAAAAGRTAPGLEPGPDIVTAAGLDPDRAQREAAHGARRSSTGATRPSCRPSARRCARPSWSAQAFLEGVPQAYVTTHADARPGAGAAARQLAGRLGRGGRAGGAALPAPAATPRSAPATRLDLARWLTSREQPADGPRLRQPAVEAVLRPRARRAALDDLGSQGEWPTHPELLDWLAVELVERGWDVKHAGARDRHVRDLPAELGARAGAAERDPGQPPATPASRASGSTPSWSATTRSRSAGCSSPKIGGPSVKPYQPAGYWANLNFPQREWRRLAGRGPVPARPLHLLAAHASCTRACWPSTRRAARSAAASARARTRRCRRWCC